MEAQASPPKMSLLYAAFLSCAGEWEQSALTIAIRKKQTLEQEEIYDWLTMAELIAKLGEALAKDLADRHVAAEGKLPASAKGRFIRRLPGCHTSP